MPDHGKTAYDAYGQSTEWLTHNGYLMPTWDALPQPQRAAWAASALAIQAQATDVMIGDLRDLLDALGMFSGARPESPHDVMREAIAVARSYRQIADSVGGLITVRPSGRGSAQATT
jgi:hypothetical protein